ncbi:MAG: hypothetical protein ACRCU2_06185 [Planktothrix sp.]
MAPTEYTIYLVNNSTATEVFWCFLAPPEELASDPNVYANSCACLAIASRAESINTFKIPVQYVVGGGSTNKAVGLQVKISSDITKYADLTDTWEVDYAIETPPNMGPSMKKLAERTTDNKIAIVSNEFNRQKNETNGWFSNMSFGIKTNLGFMGMTWSPRPAKKQTLTPKLKFYVATGDFDHNVLADWTTVSKTSAEINVPNDFEYQSSIVTLTETGTWEVKPGRIEPLLRSRITHSSILANLINSQQFLSAAQKELVDVVNGYSNANIQLTEDPLSELVKQNNELKSVKQMIGNLNQ